MGILRLLAQNTLKRIFDFKNQPLGSIGASLSMLLAITFGLVVGIMLLLTKFSPLNNTENEILDFIILGIVIITFIRGFFPSYNPIKVITNSIYPVNRITRFLINMVYEFNSIFFITNMIFFVTLSICLQEQKLIFLSRGILGVGSAHLLRRIVHFCLEYKIVNTTDKILILISGCVLVISFFLPGDYFEINNIVIVFSFLMIVNINITSSLLSKREFSLKVVNTKFIELKYLKLFFRNKMLRNSFIFETSYKIIFIIADWFTYIENGDHFGKTEYIILFFFSPISIFMSSFNNLWGFEKKLWFNLNKTEASFYDNIIVTLKLLTIPLFTHLLLVLSYYYIADNLKIFNLQFYFSCLIVLFPLSVLLSNRFPKKVEKIIQKGGNVSAIGNLISMLLVIAFVFISQHLQNYSLLIAGLLAFAIFYIAHKTYGMNKSEIFEVLYKS